MQITLRITNIDEFGYNGRDHHPSKSDIGLEVIPFKMETFVWLFDERGEPVEEVPFEPQHRRHHDVLRNVNNPTDEDFAYVVYTASTPDGRILELIEHEVEVLDAPTR